MRRLIPILLFLLAQGATALAGAELVLEDGQVLQGADVQRDGELYVLELDSGATLTIPVELVKDVPNELLLAAALGSGWGADRRERGEREGCGEPDQLRVAERGAAEWPEWLGHGFLLGVHF